MRVTIKLTEVYEIEIKDDEVGMLKDMRKEFNDGGSRLTDWIFDQGPLPTKTISLSFDKPA